MGRKNKFIYLMDYYRALVECDCSPETFNKRRKWVRKLLTEFKEGTIGETKKKILIQHIREYMTYPKEEREERCAQILCLYFLSPNPPNALQLAEQYYVERTTIFDSVNSAIDYLTFVFFGFGGAGIYIPEVTRSPLQMFVENNVELIADMAIGLYCQNKKEGKSNGAVDERVLNYMENNKPSVAGDPQIDEIECGIKLIADMAIQMYCRRNESKFQNVTL